MYKIILQNTKTALQHTGIQYIVKILVINGNVFHDQYTKVNLMFFLFLFSSCLLCLFLQVTLIC